MASLVALVFALRGSCLGFAGAPPAVYTWTSVQGDWQTPSNWMPARVAPASDDILLFNSGQTVTVTNVPTQTIGQIAVLRNTTVNLQSAADVMLAIEGGSEDDLVVEEGSALNFTGENAIVARLGPGAIATIRGRMSFSSAASAAHRLTAADSRAITFSATSVFTADTGFNGNPFGTTDLNSVVFAGGSVYVSRAGGDPFGSAEPNSVTIFEKGSLFSLQGDVTPSLSGRNYSEFEVNYPSGIFRVFGSGTFAMDDLRLVSGILDLYVSGNVKGDISISSDSRLDFVSGTTRLNGSTTQTITGSGRQGASGGSTLIIDNPHGVVLGPDRPLAAWNLQLVSGVVTVTDPTWWLGVGGTTTRTNGYVNGNLSRSFFAPGSFTFDTGTDNAYSPVRVDVISGTLPTILTIRAVGQSQPNVADPRFALSRYWQICGPPVVADLTFFYSDPLDVPATAHESNFVIEKYSGGFTRAPGVIDTAANTFHVDLIDNFEHVDWTLAEPRALLPTPTAFDFDGDSRADVSVFRPEDGAWYLLQSTNGFTGVIFGISTDKIAPADFDGDGKTDIAVYRPSQATWYWLNSSNGTLSAVPFGASEDLPLPADYDGDGRADVCVFRPSNGVWYRLNSHDGSFAAVQFGASEDKPTIGDYDGDGKADVAVFRPSNGAWYRLNSSNQQFVGVSFGLSTDLITPADFDGDGKTDVAVYRPSAATWFSLDSSNGALRAVPFGTAEDVPVAADFDGDGRADVSVFRPSNGVWYRLNSGNGQFFAVQFGTSTDRPTPAAFRY